MHKPALTLLLAVVALRSSLHAEVNLPNLPAGSQYQFIFVTSDSDTATSTSVADYNAFVTAQAALSTTLPATTWHAVVSTSTVNANVNAPWVSCLPVYNTDGILVASGTTGLYTSPGALLAPIFFTQDGTAKQTNVWTGSGGLGAALDPMGTPDPGFGSSGASNLDWIHNSAVTTATQLSLYALSGPITVPEPTTLTLSTLGAIALLIRRRICCVGCFQAIC
jgi:hypothetical protein